jgi:hypothetical protein
LASLTNESLYKSPYRSQRGATLSHLAKALKFCYLGMLTPESHSLAAFKVTCLAVKVAEMG